MSKKFNLQNAIVALITGWLVLFVMIPNIMIIGTSFLTRDEANLIEMTFTLDNYLRLADRCILKCQMHSFLYGDCRNPTLFNYWLSVRLHRGKNAHGVQSCCF